MVHQLTFLYHGGKKERSFSRHCKFYSNVCFNEYLIKLNCIPGIVPGSSKIYKSISLEVG